ncbi:nucleoside recognition domain-containing protein [Paenibacillus alkalitolerans]|uniref:nucleoside recognition domain-containing protein n=1 Tax=Paenibacillus alkalitolerans TaxID=2799335 RepID=UPI0018F38D2C|nr:nucleoside recognition domain-containing protein [Paenibacillus alkalitolerans]
MDDTVIGNSRWMSALFGISAVTLVGMIIAFPSEAFTASLSGLQVWWEFVFPALLPFFILSELLLGLGMIHAVGVLLEPLMRLLFRLPGAGGWAVAMSFTIGFPAGAKAAADLRKQGLVSRQEGNRLLALSHLCSPVFLTSVVAVGFWGHAELGLPLIIIHLVSALITGLITARIVLPAAERMYGRSRRPPLPATSPEEEAMLLLRRRLRPALPRRMLDSMLMAQRQDGRTIGKLLGEAVGSSVQSLLVIGGFMILFSVLLKLLSVSGVTGGLQLVVQALLIPWGMPPQLSEGAITALFEVHLGAYSISQSGDAGVWGAAILSSIIGWGGLSVHAQVKSLIAGTDLRYTPFLAARILHSALSIIVTFVLWEPMRRWLFPGSAGETAFSPLPDSIVPDAAEIVTVWPQYGGSLKLMALFLLAATGLSLFVRVFLPKGLFDFRRN